MEKRLIYEKEEDFREAIVIPWLRKKNFRILRQHGHGPDEQGKDIMIENTDSKIGACVVKPKIHGQYSKEGNIEEVRNQISAAMNVPFPDYINKDRRKINFVFVISENKITPSAKESIIESFKDDNNNIHFYSGEDILEEYYALPLKIKKLSLNLYYYPKDDTKREEIKKTYKDFELEEYSLGDSNNFGIFLRTHQSGKIKEVVMKKEPEDIAEVLSIDLNKLYEDIKRNSNKEPIISFFIYFEEDKIEKIENFFENYIKSKYNAPMIDKESGKITVYFENADLDRFKNLVELLRKWL